MSDTDWLVFSAWSFVNIACACVHIWAVERAKRAGDELMRAIVQHDEWAP